MGSASVSYTHLDVYKRQPPFVRITNVYIGTLRRIQRAAHTDIDIRYANERGITVTGIRDYGDEDVYKRQVIICVICGESFFNIIRIMKVLIATDKPFAKVAVDLSLIHI